MNKHSKLTLLPLLQEQDVVPFRIVQHRPFGFAAREPLFANQGNGRGKVGDLKEQDGFVP
jgi:hypothetical protein